MALTDREQRLMAEVQGEHLPETVDIYRLNTADDGFGGQKKYAPKLHLANVPARVTQAQTQAMGGEAARDIEVEFWTVRLPIGTDIRENDIVEWGDIRIEVDETKTRTYQTVLSIAGKRVK